MASSGALGPDGQVRAVDGVANIEQLTAGLVRFADLTQPPLRLPEDEEEPEILRMVEEAEKLDEPFIPETAEMEIEPETGTDDEDLEVRKKRRCQPWRDTRPRFKYRKTHKSHKEEEMATIAERFPRRRWIIGDYHQLRR